MSDHEALTEVKIIRMWAKRVNGLHADVPGFARDVEKAATANLSAIIERQRTELRRLYVLTENRTRTNTLHQAVESMRYTLPPGIPPNSPESLAFHKGYIAAKAQAAAIVGAAS